MRLRLERLEQRNLLAGDLTERGIDIVAVAPSSHFGEAKVNLVQIRIERYASEPELYQKLVVINQRPW